MFFPSAKIIIRNPNDFSLLFLVKRGSFYEPAGGKVEIDFNARLSESLEECALREAKEELGVTAQIESYLGSYYFFWSIDRNKASSCAVFLGNFLEQDTSFSSNSDLCELTITPEWVSIHEVVNKINPEYIGLQKIFDSYQRALK
jgi:8-oxo-dGTP pyrophosphatase MutT (NUDIX family)